MTKEIILVTGCCGRIGLNVIRKLQDKYTVIGLDLPQAINKSCPCETVPVDLRHQQSILDALSYVQKKHGAKICSVIHLAAYYSFTNKHSSLYKTITVQGTEKLLSALRHFQVDQFVFTSTMLIHKPTTIGKPISESSPIEPKWEYPKSKVETEKAIHKLSGDIPTVFLRIAGVYDDGCHSIPISNQIQRIYEKRLESKFFSGNIRSGSSFVHMDDVVDAIFSCVEKRKELPHELPLLIGEEKTLSYDTLQRRISFLLRGREITTYSLPKWIAKIGAHLMQLIFRKNPPFIQPWMIDLADDHYELDISSAKRHLNWHPKQTLQKTLPLMIEKLKKDPIQWYKENGLK